MQKRRTCLQKLTDIEDGFSDPDEFIELIVEQLKELMWHNQCVEESTINCSITPTILRDNPPSSYKLKMLQAMSDLLNYPYKPREAPQSISPQI